MLKKRNYISAIIGIVIILAGFMISEVLSNSNSNKKRTRPNDKKIIPTISVVNSIIKSDLQISGRVNSYKKIEIFSEVSGILLESAKVFKPGNRYKKGELILFSENNNTIISRIIGTEGENVEFEINKFYINRIHVQQGIYNNS